MERSGKIINTTSRRIDHKVSPLKSICLYNVILSGRADKPSYLCVLHTIINSNQTPRSVVFSLIRLLLDEFIAQKGTEKVNSLLVTLNQRYLGVYEKVAQEKLNSVMDEVERKDLEEKLFRLLNVSAAFINLSSSVF
jgi:hypothetical protein